jgi:acetylornithine deacetylase/succinyl-diaminopimelate desuccinylase-like protein
MLKAGHAENALPQSATATVNCRIFPGVPVSEIEATLKRVVANEAVQFKQTYEATESPISELREDVVDAVSEAVERRYPEVQIIAYMESGGTDGMHFRRAGIPTWAVSGIFMNPDEMFAHGLNERVPLATLDGALMQWRSLLRDLSR